MRTKLRFDGPGIESLGIQLRVSINDYTGCGTWVSASNSRIAVQEGKCGIHRTNCASSYSCS